MPNTPPPAAAAAPTLRFVLAHPAHAIALGFGAGLSPIAPGTAGTLWGWASFALAWPWLQPLGGPLQLALLGLATLLGWWACTRCAEDLQRPDPGCIVWDEIVAFWLVLGVLGPVHWVWQALAFGLFRYFDAAKPGPVAWADRAFKGPGWRGGFGILFDDLVAALCTLLLLGPLRVLL